ncbi:MAG TPA: hypothetical protein VGF30_04800 [Bacteroidia bacterium]
MLLGKMDISRYVAIGDSVTSGYSDGALYYDAQLTSYPNLLANQFKSYGGGEFRQALINKDSVGIGFYENSRMVLKKDDPYTNSTGLSFLAPQGDLSVFLENIYPEHGPFHNMGIPGLKAITAILPGYGNPANGLGNFNPFFSRIASNPKVKSVLDDVLAIRPTFFTLFIGNNDVLAYALSGGTSDLITPAFATASDLNFEGAVNKMVDALLESGAKGAIANIPDIWDIPFFTSIPFNGLLIGKKQANQLNLKYPSTKIYFKEGNNPFLVQTQEGVRQMKAGELILMDVLFDPDKHACLAGEIPIPKKYVLTSTEAVKVQNTITEYNAILESIAKSNKLAFVNTNALVKTVAADRVYDGRTFNLCYQKKRVFSLDGLHLNSLGQALLSNAFIKAINATYGSSIPKINLLKYRRMTECE